MKKRDISDIPTNNCALRARYGVSNQIESNRNIYQLIESIKFHINDIPTLMSCCCWHELNVTVFPFLAARCLGYESKPSSAPINTRFSYNPSVTNNKPITNNYIPAEKPYAYYPTSPNRPSTPLMSEAVSLTNLATSNSIASSSQTQLPPSKYMTT